MTRGPRKHLSTTIAKVLSAVACHVVAASPLLDYAEAVRTALPALRFGKAVHFFVSRLERFDCGFIASAEVRAGPAGFARLLPAFGTFAHPPLPVALRNEFTAVLGPAVECVARVRELFHLGPVLGGFIGRKATICEKFLLGNHLAAFRRGERVGSEGNPRVVFEALITMPMCAGHAIYSLGEYFIADDTSHRTESCPPICFRFTAE